MANVNPHKGDVAFKIGEKTYVMRYSIDAICVLEDRTGKTLAELAECLKDVKSLRMSLVREMLYAGLIEHQPEITVKEAGELMIAAGGAINVVGKFVEGIGAAYPSPAPEAAGKPHPRKRAR